MAYLHKELEDLSDLDFVNKIEFGLMNPDMIRKGSVVEVTSNNTYEGTVPKVKGLLDPRMGVLEGGKICPIDKNTSHVCPGYFGHIELALPVYNLSYLQWIRKTLSCVCFRCSNLLIDKNDTSLMKKLVGKDNKERFDYISSAKVKEYIKQHRQEEQQVVEDMFNESKITKIGEKNVEKGSAIDFVLNID